MSFDSDDDEGDVPPLLSYEDLRNTPAQPEPSKVHAPAAALTHNVGKTPVAPSASNSSSAAPVVPTSLPPAATETKPAALAAAKPAVKPSGASAGAATKPASSGGLKKGFLSSGSAKKERQSSAERAKAAGGASAGKPSSAAAEIPTIRGDGSGGKSSLRMDEVQRSLDEQGASAARVGAGVSGTGGTSWVTPDLLKKIAADPVLSLAFTDPKYQDAMTAIQTDPQGAMQKYGHIPEMQQFMMKFMKLMGEHFTELGMQQDSVPAPQQQAAPKTKEARAAEEAAAKALKDPEVVAILQDPQVQAVLNKLRDGRSLEVEQEMRQPEMMLKLQKLSQAGLIGMEWRP